MLRGECVERRTVHVHRRAHVRALQLLRASIRYTVSGLGLVEPLSRETVGAAWKRFELFKRGFSSIHRRY